MSYNPHETVTIHHRGGVPVWVFVLSLVAVVLLGFPLLAWLVERQRGERLPKDVVDPATAEALIQDAPASAASSGASPYAVELAALYFGGAQPSADTVAEFDSLIKEARRLYSRCTDRGVRDATYEVYALRQYKPDITTLSALRMLVDWKPGQIVVQSDVSGTYSDTTSYSGERSGTVTSDGRQQVSASKRLSVEDIPISEAVADIRQQVLHVYKSYYEAQQEAYAAQQAAARQKAEERRQREANILHNQTAGVEAAKEQARIAAEEQAERRAYETNNPYGQHWSVRNPNGR